MKKYFTILTFFAISASLFSQGTDEKLLSNKEFFKNSDYILEVSRSNIQAVSYDSKGDFNKEDIYNSSYWVVNYVYKMNGSTIVTEGDTIEIISKGGSLVRKLIIDGVVLYEPIVRTSPYPGTMEWMFREKTYDLVLTSNRAILFLKKNTFPENNLTAKDDVYPKNEYPNNNFLKVNYLQNREGGALFVENRITGLNALDFPSRDSLCSYMKQYKKYGVDGNNYYKTNDAYWKKKYAELEEFKKNYPIFEIPENINTLREWDSITNSIHREAQKYREKSKSISIDKRDKSATAKKYNDEIDAFLKDRMHEIGIKLKAIQNRITGHEKVGMNDTRNPQGNEAWVFFMNHNTYYDFESNRNYYEFDICMRANNSNTYLREFCRGLYFVDGCVTVESSLVSSNKVTVTLGENLNPNIYYIWTNDMIGNDPGFFVNVYDAMGPLDTAGLVNVTENTLKLLHIKVELLDEVNTNFKINFDVNYDNNFALSYDVPEPPYNCSWFHYDTVFLENPESSMSLNSGIKPEIHTDLSNITKHAGTNDILTIAGRGFGDERGEVHFTRNDGGGKLEDGNIDWLKGLDDQYYVSWSNEEIKVTVPSFVKKGYVLGSEALPEYGSGAGSGKIYVKTANNDSVISDNDLQIDYSIANSSDVYEFVPISRVYLARQDCNHDFVFTLHNSLQGSSGAQARTVIEAAIAKWKQMLPNIDIVVEKNISGQYVYATNFDNTKNVIGFTNDPIGGNPYSIMGTAQRFFPGTGNGAFMYYREKASHIFIKAGYTWNYQTSGTVNSSQTSFQTAFLHELGHFLLLNHVIDSTDLMHYATDSSIAQPVMTLNSSDVSVGAVTEIVNLSKNITWTYPYTNIATLGNAIASTPPIINASPSNALSCNGTPVTLSASNVASTNILQWKKNGLVVGSANPLNVTAGGIYSLTASNGMNNCNATSNSIEVKSGILTANFDVTYPHQDMCSGAVVGGAIDVTISDTSTHPPFIFNWNTGATTENLTNLSIGLYSVIITNNIGCSINYSKIFPGKTIPIQPLQVQITLEKNCIAFANVSGGTPPYTYKWTKSCDSYARPPVISTINTADVKCCDKSLSTIITLTVTDANGCSKIIDVPCCNNMKQETPKSSVEDLSTNKQPILYPNPTSGKFQIRGIQQADIQIFNSNGALLYSQKNISESSEINLDNLSNGLYIVKIIEEENISNLRIIIEKQQ